MKLSALVRFSQQDVYMSLTILGCTVSCRFRFANCPLYTVMNVFAKFDEIPSMILQDTVDSEIFA